MQCCEADIFFVDRKKFSWKIARLLIISFKFERKR